MSSYSTSAAAAADVADPSAGGSYAGAAVGGRRRRILQPIIGWKVISKNGGKRAVKIRGKQLGSLAVGRECPDLRLKETLKPPLKIQQVNFNRSPDDDLIL